MGRDLTPRPVSGLGTIETFTINHHAWTVDLEVPYVVAIVSLDDCSTVRLTTNVIDCAPSDVHIGDAVRVVFEQQDDVWLPLFVSA
jgi:uncharacterized OB-fold protein